MVLPKLKDSVLMGKAYNFFCTTLRIVTLLICVFYVVGGFGMMYLYCAELGVKLSAGPDKQISFVTRKTTYPESYLCGALASIVFGYFGVCGVLQKKLTYMVPFMSLQVIIMLSVMINTHGYNLSDGFLRLFSLFLLAVTLIGVQLWLARLLTRMIRREIYDARMKGQYVPTVKPGDIKSSGRNDGTVKPLNVILNMNITDTKMIPLAVQSALMIRDLGPNKITFVDKTSHEQEQVIFPLPPNDDEPNTSANPPPYTATVTYENEVSLTPPEEDSQAPPPYTMQDPKQSIII